jgi:hypothetical protein
MSTNYDNKIQKILTFMRKLERALDNRESFNNFVDNLDEEDVDHLKTLIINVMRRKVPIIASLKKKLKPLRKTIDKFIDKKKPINPPKAKKVLMTGGAISLLSLILYPAISSLVGSVASRVANKYLPK